MTIQNTKIHLSKNINKKIKKLKRIGTKKKFLDKESNIDLLGISKSELR